MSRLVRFAACCVGLLALGSSPALAARKHLTRASSTPASTSASLEAELARLRSDPSVAADSASIIETLTSGSMKGMTWSRLAEFTDTIGPRLCGSETLETAVDYMVKQLQADGLENVHAEQTSLPLWHRGSESVTLLEPRVANLNMLGLGGSIGTQQYGPEGLTAEVLVVASFDELKARASEAKGKIVAFNQFCDWVNKPVDCYGESVSYRYSSWQAVSAVGGLASLVRSVAAFSINSPHTGVTSQDASPSAPSIPTAALTIEDAAMLARMAARNQTIRINLKMEAKMVQTDAVGHNVVAEIKGSEKPDEVVIVSGHLDSWDVGVGAMDDGGGALISWSVLSVLRRLNLRPKRTIRLVMWSCEEMGGIGAGQYFTAHKAEVPSMSMVAESDMGVFNPYGLQFTGNAAATAIMTQIGTLLRSINGSAVVGGGDGEDIAPWMQAGVPGASLANDNQRYFWVHHSGGDRMEVLDPAEVDRCAAVWAVHAYNVANLNELLPRDK